MTKVSENLSTPLRGSYDIIVAGGGLAGIAAAVAARRAGKSVLLLEKSVMLGGLATLGLVTMFVPMCNGRGVPIIKGMAEEFFRLSAKYSFDTIPNEWSDGYPSDPSSVKSRYITRFSAPIFALTLTELIESEGVTLLYDSQAVLPVMNGNVCKGVVVENKTGRGYYEASQIIDCTGDADLLRRAGVPTVVGKNYLTYYALSTSLDACKRACDTGNIRNLETNCFGGKATLYGKYHPEGMKMFEGVTAEETTEYVLLNQRLMLDGIKKDERFSRDILALPCMPQFRETCRIDGDATLDMDDVYKHFDDSVGAICDFDHCDSLFEVRLGCLCRKDFPNLITAGRSAAARGYAWDILRVIPPAILTGQAAGEAASLAIDTGKGVAQVDISELQRRLTNGGVDIHFDDSLVPASLSQGETVDLGHI